MKKIDYNAIQKEIKKNYKALKSGEYDVYKFIAYISEKYFKPVDLIWIFRDTSMQQDPYADLLFAMLEINEIELY